MNDKERYTNYLVSQAKRYEGICKRCGKCCGAGGSDPCSQLISLGNGLYQCTNYTDRLGEQKTVSGKTFNCVPVREVLKYQDTLIDCAYRKI